MAEGLLKDFPKLKHVKSPNKKNFTDEDVMSKIEQAFALIDVDKNGTLSAEELKLTSDRLKIGLTNEECKEFVADIDIDGIGEINIFDFSHILAAAANRNPTATVDDLIKDGLNNMKATRKMKAQMREKGLKKKMKEISKTFDA